MRSKDLTTRSGPFQEVSAALEGESLKRVIENYLSYYAAGETHTARAKRYDLEYFLLHLAGHPDVVDNVTVSDWTMDSTQTFVESRLSLGEAPATVSRRLATIKHFGRTLAERVPGYLNPAREVRAPKQSASRPDGLVEEEVTALVQAAENARLRAPEQYVPYRNEVLLKLLLGTGLRADEARLLVLSQVSRDFSWLKNVRTKGKKYRNVYLDSSLRPLIENYLQLRTAELLLKHPELQSLTNKDSGRFPFFLSFYRVDVAKPSSFGLSPKSVWRIINTLGKEAADFLPASIGKIHPHRLRHTFAHGLLDSSKDIRLVAQALGHSDVRTTMRYTERTEEEIAIAIERKISSR